MIKYTIDDVKIIANEKGGECLSTNYINNRTKLKFRCTDKHIFNMRLSNIISQGQWCPKCIKYLSEEICRFSIENIFDKKFDKFFFKYKKHHLELDGYNQSLQIAFEYNGKQHYEITKFTPSLDELKYRKYLDNLKIEYCDINNIELVIIPYTTPNDEILNFLKKRYNSNIEIDINKFINNYSYTRKRKTDIKNIIKNKGKLIDFKMDKIIVQCKCERIWETKYNILKNGHWCKQCSNSLSISDVKNRLYPIICLTEVKRKKMEFICENGHKFQDFYINVIKRKDSNIRKGCPKCLTNKQYRILNLIEKNGMKPLDIAKYKNRNSEIEWVCENKTITIDKLKNINERLKRTSNVCNCEKCLNIS